MAIIKTIPTGYGVDASYWEIQKITFDRDSGVAIDVYGYVSKAVKQAGGNPLPSAEFHFFYTLDEVGMQNIITLHNFLQNMILLKPELAGGVID